MPPLFPSSMLEYKSLFKTLFFSLKSIYPFPHYNIFFFQNIWVIHPVPSIPGVIYKKLKEAELIYPQESEHQPTSVCSSVCQTLFWVLSAYTTALHPVTDPFSCWGKQGLSSAKWWRVRRALVGSLGVAPSLWSHPSCQSHRPPSQGLGVSPWTCLPNAPLIYHFCFHFPTLSPPQMSRLGLGHCSQDSSTASTHLPSTLSEEFLSWQPGSFST